MSLIYIFGGNCIFFKKFVTLFTAKKMIRKPINFTFAKTFLRVGNNWMAILSLFIYIDNWGIRENGVLFECWRMTILALIRKWMSWELNRLRPDNRCILL